MMMSDLISFLLGLASGIPIGAIIMIIIVIALERKWDKP